MQIKSFTKWVNLHLAKMGMEVQDLKTDFKDGIKLLKLIEVISEESLGKYNKKALSKFQKIENLNIPLAYINNFIKEQGIRNFYSAENILEEDEVLILGMVWSLILRFAVQNISEGDRNAKEGLLLWAQKKVDEGSKGKIKVTNFHSSWQDGMAFCSLINAYRPDLIDYASCKKSDDPEVKMRNLNYAFDIAEKQFGIAKMLDAVDMVGARPDEKSVMT
jgi:actinin alpha